MAKRGATSELNDRNWDEEEEPEEAGVFVQADKETLQNRVIKRAKRRGAGGEEEGAKTSAFSGFGGLTSASASTKSSNTFSGFKLSTSITKPSSTGGMVGLFGQASSSASAPPVNGNSGSQKACNKNGSRSDKGDWKDSPAYFSFLKSLNQSVLAWIKQHVEENPYIILTPIFKDYEKYLQSQETESSSSSSSSSDSAAVHSPTAKKEAPAADLKDSDSATLPAAAVNKSNEAPSLSVFGQKASAKDESSKADKPKAPEATKDGLPGSGSEASKGFSFGTTAFSGTGGFSFSSGAKTTTNNSSTTTSATFGKSGFSFGTTSTTTTAPSTGFSFGTTTSKAAASGGFSFGTSSSSSSTAGTSGFSFGVAARQATSSSAGASQSSNGQNDDDEYVPPKPEVREIKEDDALYSKRCKLYFQRNDQWVDRGVGNLHLKPVEDSKTQILIRADTNLGNILLNVMLSASMPVSRQGKNNVVLVCVPNPPLDSKAGEESEGENSSKPVPMLVRVKGGDDADELFGKIEDRKALLA